MLINIRALTGGAAAYEPETPVRIRIIIRHARYTPWELLANPPGGLLVQRFRVRTVSLNPEGSHKELGQGLPRPPLRGSGPQWRPNAHTHPRTHTHNLHARTCRYGRALGHERTTKHARTHARTHARART